MESVVENIMENIYSLKILLFLVFQTDFTCIYYNVSLFLIAVLGFRKNS